jgi:hypothetical protein
MHFASVPSNIRQRTAHQAVRIGVLDEIRIGKDVTADAGVRELLDDVRASAA